MHENGIYFFDNPVRKLIQLGLDNLDDNYDRDELNSILRASVKLSLMTRHYMSHRLRAKVQFISINKIKQWVMEDK